MASRSGARRGHGPAEQPRAQDVDADQAEQRPVVRDAAHAGEPVEAVADGDRGGQEVRELAEDRARRGIDDVEAHEPRAVVARRVVRGDHELAELGGHRGDDRIGRQQRAALRDLHAFVDVAAGILAAEDVLRRRPVEPQPARHDGDRHQRAESGPGRFGPEPQPAAADDRERHDDAGLDQEQPLEAIPAEDREPEGEHHRQAARQDHRPEHPLLGGQRGPSTGIEQGQPEEEGPGQPGDQGEGEERP